MVCVSLYDLTQQIYMSIQLIHGQRLERGRPIKTNKQTNLEGDWTNLSIQANKISSLPVCRLVTMQDFLLLLLGTEGGT